MLDEGHVIKNGRRRTKSMLGLSFCRLMPSQIPGATLDDAPRGRDDAPGPRHRLPRRVFGGAIHPRASSIERTLRDARAALPAPLPD